MCCKETCSEFRIFSKDKVLIFCQRHTGFTWPTWNWHDQTLWMFDVNVRIGNWFSFCVSLSLFSWNIRNKNTSHPVQLDRKKKRKFIETTSKLVTNFKQKILSMKYTFTNADKIILKCYKKSFNYIILN